MDAPDSHPHEARHGHDHDHDHDHDQHGSSLSAIEARVKALETLLTRKGYVDGQALDAVLANFEARVGPHNGARVVAKAWSEPAFLDWLRRDATAAVHSLGIHGPQGGHLSVVENTDAVHNVVVCTLCSCYPWPLLGLPPGWYKSASYRGRVVIEPRQVLQEFGLHLPSETKIRVWDSTADQRYLVLPQRPAHTEGLSQEALAALVTRDAMIGTGLALAAQGAA